MAVGNTYRLSIVGSYQDQTIVNTLHFLQSATIGGGVETPDEIIFRFSGGSGATPLTRYAGCLPSLWHGSQLNVINVQNPFDNRSATINITGTRSPGESLPSQCCALLSLRTAGLGRSYRGRFYLGPVPRGDVSGNNITASYSSALELFVNAVRDSFNSSPLAWVVWSRRLGTATPVSRIIIRLPIATQRRRSGYNPG